MKKIITNIRLWLPVAALVISLVLHNGLPNKQLVMSNSNYTVLLLVLTVFFIAWTIVSYFRESWREKLLYRSPFFSVCILLVLAYEVVTLKLFLLPLPYFPSPVKIFEAYINDWQLLLQSLFYSVRLLLIGNVIGLVLGIITGILMGWYKCFDYWINPFFRLIGPVPPAALVPVAIIIFPTSFAASIFLIVLSVWFPVTVMTWSAVVNLDKSYLDVARTLGGGNWYQLSQVVLPAAAPSIFFGVFMGFGYSFATLVIAEMLGVKAGIGWYLNWVMKWSEYYKVYAAILLMAFLCAGLIWLLFKTRKRVLGWQKGMVKW